MWAKHPARSIESVIYDEKLLYHTYPTPTKDVQRLIDLTPPVYTMSMPFAPYCYNVQLCPETGLPRNSARRGILDREWYFGYIAAFVSTWADHYTYVLNC